MSKDNCPKCGVSLIGDPIPEDIREHYSGTHWRRERGVEVLGLYDGVAYWQCPDCEHEWAREGMEFLYDEVLRRRLKETLGNVSGKLDELEKELEDY